MEPRFSIVVKLTYGRPSIDSAFTNHSRIKSEQPTSLRMISERWFDVPTGYLLRLRIAIIMIVFKLLIVKYPVRVLANRSWVYISWKRDLKSVESEWNDIPTQIYRRYYLKYCHHDTSLLSRSKIATLKASIFQKQIEKGEARNNVEMLALFEESINVVWLLQ